MLRHRDKRRSAAWPAGGFPVPAIGPRSRPLAAAATSAETSRRSWLASGCHCTASMNEGWPGPGAERFGQSSA